MKIKKLIISLIAIIIFMLSINLKSSPTTLDDNKNDIITKFTIKKEFDMVKKKFNYYNKNIGDSTVRQFIKVVNFYELNNNIDELNLYISQICYESGAKQYDSNGKIMKSTANAIGITQIRAITAFHYLRNILSKKERETFKLLGGTDMSFVDKYPRYEYNSDAWEKCRVWLSNENNNIILWGYIMKDLLNKGCDINSSFVAYNGGSGHLNSWIKNGNLPSAHPYVIKIVNITENLKVI